MRISVLWHMSSSKPLLDRAGGELSDESNEFFDEVTEQLSVTDWTTDRTLDEFKEWLAVAIASYPELPLRDADGPPLFS